MKKLLSLILLVLMTAIVLPISALASVNMNITQDTTPPSSYFKRNGYDWINSLMYYQGDVAYCIGLDSETIPSGHTMQEAGEIKDEKLAKIISAGYPFTASQYGLSNKDYQYTTQMVVRMYQTNVITGSNMTINELTNTNTAMLNEAKRIWNAQNNSTNPTRMSVTISGTDSRTLVTVAGNQYYRYGPYKPSVTNGTLTGNYNVVLGNNNAIATSASSPTSLIKQDKYSFFSVQSFYVFTPATSSGSSTITLDIPKGSVQKDIEVYGYTNSGSVQDVAVIKLKVEEAISSSPRSISWNSAVGGLSITKRYQNSLGTTITPTTTQIAQTKFALKKQGGNYIILSGSNGSYSYDGESPLAVNYIGLNSTSAIGTVTGLPPGNYEIIESSVPAGFIKSENVNVTVSAGNTVTRTITNREDVGSLTINKEFATTTGAVLNASASQNQQVRFRLAVKGTNQPVVLTGSGSGGTYTYAGTGTASTILLNSNGKATITNLPLGEYVIIEDFSGNSFIKSANVDVSVTSSNKTPSVTITNTEQGGKIALTKSTVGNNNIANIKFNLQGKSDSGRNINVAVTTDKNGIANFYDIPIGSYTIYEDGLTVPFAYLTADPQGVVVEYNKTTDVTFENEEKTGSIQVTKATVGSRNIEGIKFNLSGTSDSGRTISLTATTNSTGKAMFSNVPIGTYTITEDGTSVPTAYLVADSQQVTVTHATQSSLTFSNEEKTGSIQVTKSTTGNRNIEGIKFNLNGTSDSGRAISLTATTNSTGKATFSNVPIGTYTITEDGTSVPTAYLVADSQEVIVTHATQSTLTFSNEEKTGSIQVTKATTGNRNIEGIKFNLNGTSDSGRAISLTATTNSTGIASFYDIPIGTYTVTEDEKSVPFAYLTAEPQSVIVDYAETSTVNFFNEEKTGSIRLTKVTINSTNIAGIGFELRGTSDSGRAIVLGAVTDQYGSASFHVPMGSYTIFEDETTVPYAYLTAEPQGVTVNYAETSDVEIVNHPKTGKVVITKYDIADNTITLAKCGIRILDEYKNAVLEGYTDKNGVLEFELPVGKYYYQEFEPPAGYLIDDKAYMFEIKEDGEIVKAKLEDPKIPESPPSEVPPTGHSFPTLMLIIGFMALAVVGTCYFVKRKAN